MQQRDANPPPQVSLFVPTATPRPSGTKTRQILLYFFHIIYFFHQFVNTKLTNVLQSVKIRSRGEFYEYLVYRFKLQFG